MEINIMKRKQMTKSSDKVNIRIELQREIWNRFKGQCIYHSLDWKKEVWLAIEKHLGELERKTVKT
jgi:hypothetical protein